MASLPALPVGDAWVWSPGWPTVDGIFQRVHVLPIETFDSGATPKVGSKPVEPKAPASVDLEAFERQMAATIERAKADDPKTLRARIAELEKQLKAKPATPAAPAPKLVEVPVLKDGQLQRLEKLAGRLEEIGTKLVTSGALLRDVIAPAVSPASAPTRPPAPQPVARNGAAHGLVPSAWRRTEPREAGEGGDLPKGEAAVLNAIAQHPGGASREQLSVLTAYKRSSLSTYLQKLQARAAIEVRGNVITATEAGLAALGDRFQPLPTGDELREYWLQRLPVGEGAVLKVVLDAYPDPITGEAIDESTGYLRSSRNTYLQKLTARKLIERVGRGEVRASAALFSAEVAR